MADRTIDFVTGAPVAGDAQFAGRPATTVVGRELDAVRTCWAAISR